MKCAACRCILGQPDCPEDMEKLFAKYDDHLIQVHKFVPHCVNTLKVRTKLEVWTKCPIYDVIQGMEENASFTSLEFQKVFPIVIPSLPDGNLTALDIDSDPDFTPPPGPVYVPAKQLQSVVRYDDVGEVNLDIDITREEIVSSKDNNNKEIIEAINLAEIKANPSPKEQESKSIDLQEVTEKILEKKIPQSEKRDNGKRKYGGKSKDSFSLKKIKLGIDGSERGGLKNGYSEFKKTAIDADSEKSKKTRMKSYRKDRKEHEHEYKERVSDKTAKDKKRVKVKSRNLGSNKIVKEFSEGSMVERLARQERNVSNLIKSSSMNRKIDYLKDSKVAVKKTKKVQFEFNDNVDDLIEESEETPCPWFEFGVHRCRICSQSIYLGFFERHLAFHSMPLDLYMSENKISPSSLEIGAYECRICEVKVAHTNLAISSHLSEIHELRLGNYYANYEAFSTKSQISSVDVEGSPEVLGQKTTDESATLSNSGSDAGKAKKKLPWTELPCSCRLCGEVVGFSGLVAHLKKDHDKMTKKCYLANFPNERKCLRYWLCKICATKHVHTTKSIENHLTIFHSMTASKYDESFNDDCAIVYDNFEEERKL